MSNLERESLPPGLVEEFLVEARENLQRAEEALHALESDFGQKSAINDIFRCIHTIKGSSSYLEFNQIKELSHIFENLLDLLRRQETLRVSAELLELFFEIIDAMSKMVDQCAGDGDAVDTSKLKTSLEAEIKNWKEICPSGSTSPAATAAHTPKVNASDIFASSLKQQMDALSHCFTSIIESDGIVKPEIRNVLTRTLKTLESSARFVGNEEVEATSARLLTGIAQGVDEDGKASDEVLNTLVSSIGILEKTLIALTGRVEATKLENQNRAETEAEPEPVAPVSVTKSVPERTCRDSSKTMRVDEGLIEEFMNLVGELVIAKNALEHFQLKLNSDSGDGTQVLSRELRQTTARVAHISGELQHTVRQIRLVPIHSLFQRFPRILRDLSRQTGKRVELQFEGEDTEIDKKLADELNEPLLHLVRNAVDHGIEAPEVRQSNKKAPTGQLTFKAYHENSSVFLEVSDDGKGIDRDAVLAKAIERGLVSAEGLEKISDEQIFELIFAPGFSTAQSVTEISGRGVGMDVVRTSIEKMHGKISVVSRPKQGTTIRIELPLTTAVMESILVSSGSQVYALPLQNIVEIVKVSTHEMKSMMSRKAISLRGEIVGVERLQDVLPTKAYQQDGPAPIKVPVLLVQSGSEKIGLVVDHVLRTEEIVVKPVPAHMKEIPGVSGVSVLGDGRAILILDPGRVLQIAVSRMDRGRKKNIV